MRTLAALVLVLVGTIAIAAEKESVKPWTEGLYLTSEGARALDLRSIPWLTAYDAKGELLLVLRGYSPDHAALLPSLARGSIGIDAIALSRRVRARKPRGWTLDRELSFLRKPAGGGVSREELREGAATLIEYQAAWCVPCRALERDLDAFLARNPNVRTNALRVDVDRAMRGR
jgi:thiol-disulfide isomerase/thioredoxin